MSRRKSIISTRKDDGDMDVDASELTKLQRQFRIMDREHKAYSVQAHKQNHKLDQEIENLKKEQEELRCELGVFKSLRRNQPNPKVAKEYNTFLDQIQLIKEDMDKERGSQKHLEQEVFDLTLKFNELRRREVTLGDTLKTEAQKTQKAIRTLEDTLDRASARLSEEGTKCRQLNKEQQILHIERGHFQQLYKRLEKELQEVRKKMGEVINQSTAAYDTRVVAQTKMTAVKEKTDKVLTQYNVELKEMERLILHDQNYKSFMTTKCIDRPSEEDHKRVSYVKETRRIDSLGEESLETLEEVFERIQQATGEDNLEVMVAKFLENGNSALFNFVNEQNKEVEALRDQINQINEEMEQFQMKSLAQEENHGLLIKEISDQPKDLLSQAEEYETQADGISKTLDLVKTKCDQSVKEESLGSSAEINDNNIMSYLRLIEQKTNEMLTLHTIRKVSI
ncbi:coiled-coil domain-containing protein 63-like [Eucyclogobius newberryi]|uniref:coiled-coil domain-containing protein 63-like n=1 Tax=Eucyclogobius newberryi TaxID=166745 RepID=UPI003B5A697C